MFFLELSSFFHDPADVGNLISKQIRVIKINFKNSYMLSVVKDVDQLELSYTASRNISGTTTLENNLVAINN